MNTGIISSRYSRALLRFAEDQGETEAVLKEAKTLEKALLQSAALHRYLSDPSGVTPSQKMALLWAALGKKDISATMEKFLRLLIHNNREAELRFILHSFIDRYYKSRGIRFATLTTAVEASPELEKKIQSMAESLFGGTFVVDKKVDPSILWGMIFTVEDFRLDASVSSRLRALKKEFNEKNSRIV